MCLSGWVSLSASHNNEGGFSRLGGLLLVSWIMKSPGWLCLVSESLINLRTGNYGCLYASWVSRLIAHSSDISTLLLVGVSQWDGWCSLMVIHSISLKLTSKLTDVEMHEVHLIMTEMEIDELQVRGFNKSILFSYCASLLSHLLQNCALHCCDCSSYSAGSLSRTWTWWW